MDTAESDSYCLAVTIPQNPWQQPGGQPSYGPSPGGVPQPGQQPYPQQAPYPQGQHPQQSGQPGYGQYGAPPAPQADLRAVPRPVTVEVAFWISVVAPLVGTILTVVGFLLLQNLVDDAVTASFGESGIDAASPEMTEAMSVFKTVFISFAIFVTVLMLILTGLWILFGFKMRAGRNWARVVLTIFASLWALNGFFGLLSGGASLTSADLPPGVPEPTGLVALSYAQSAFGLLAMVSFVALVFLKPSNWYFQASAHR